MYTMTKRRQDEEPVKERLYKAIDTLSEKQMDEVIAFIASIDDKDFHVLSPDSKEPPLTDDELAMIEKSRKELSAGKGISLEDALKEL